MTADDSETFSIIHDEIDGYQLVVDFQSHLNLMRRDDS